MSAKQCKSCLGSYETMQPDGTEYFHVCPPGIPTADVRNENPKSTAERSTDTVISEGKGVQDVK